MRKFRRLLDRLLSPRPMAGDEAERIAQEFGVAAVFDATEPPWYTRLTGRFRLTWRREVATTVTLFAVGVVTGFVVAVAIGR